MSESPPPVDDHKASSENVNNMSTNNDSDDLFFSTIGEANTTVDNSDKQNMEDMDELFNINSPKKKEISASLDATNEIRLDEDDDSDPFGGSKKEPSGLSPSATSLDQPFALNNSSLPTATPSINIKPAVAASNSSSNVGAVNASLAATSISASIPQVKKTAVVEDESDEDRDKFIEISVSEPTKVGEGMSSFMTYKVTTKTNFPVFKKQDFSTNRRFSDFLNLYEKLKEKHLQYGRIVPPPPEKDMLGTTKIKMSSNKDEANPSDFIERRKAHLERFLNRIGQHPSLRNDPDFRDFLEISDGLPKATNTSALSGANVMKLFKSVGEAVQKISVKMPQGDQWFEEKSHEVENLSLQLKKVHASMESLYGWRRDLATATKDFAKSAAILASSEEHINLAKAVTQLGDLYEKVDEIHVEQAHSDFYTMSELMKDYIGLLEAVREVFYQRIKVFQNWQKAEETLKSKQDTKTKLETSNKQDKIPTILAEIRDWETKVEKGKEEFEQISKTIKQEMKRFELKRVHEFKDLLVKYLNKLLEHQQTLVKIWEQYLPEVKAI